MAKPTSGITTRPIAPYEFAALATLLEAEGLPADDIAEPDVRLFAFEAGHDILGYGGIEQHGEEALLRSIVVPSAHRGKGHGREIVAAMQAEAAQLGARRLFLLTTSARAFFESLGFTTTDRAEAPEAILATRQAASLCPNSAPLMRKALT